MATIFYSLIARDNHTVLCDADFSAGNYPQVTFKLLEKNNLVPSFRTYAFKEFTYYFLNEPPFTFVCLAKAEESKTKCVAFLRDIRQRFFDQFRESERENAIAYALNDKFSNTMKSRMKHFSESDEKDPQLKRLIDELKSTDQLMTDNIEAINLRGEKLEILVTTTKQTKSEATGLDRRAHRLHQKYKCENIRKYIILCLLFFIVLYGAFAMICGGLSMPNCFNQNNSQQSNIAMFLQGRI